MVHAPGRLPAPIPLSPSPVHQPRSGRRGGGGGRGHGVRSHVAKFGGSPLRSISHYFGIDLEQIGNLSDRELAELADRAKRMKDLREIIPILEQHFTELIEGQLEYEQFIQRMLKAGTAAAKKIDKASLDAWLLDKGYQLHVAQLGSEADRKTQQMQAEHDASESLANLSLQTTLSIVAMRRRRAEETDGKRLPTATAQARVAEMQTTHKKRRMEYITHGSNGAHGRGVGWFDRAVRWLGQ